MCGYRLINVLCQRKSQVSAKAARDSRVEATHLVLPSDANTLGITFGGRIMAWMVGESGTITCNVFVPYFLKWFMFSLFMTGNGV